MRATHRAATRPAPLPMFLWHGTGPDGQPLAGEACERSPALVRARLRQRGIVVRRLRRKRRAWNLQARPRGRDIAWFSRQLATLVRAGVPLLAALDAMAAAQPVPAMRPLLAELRADIASGLALHEALARHRRHFGPLYLALVKAGESAGALHDTLDTLADHQEQGQALKARLQRALAYPATIVLVALGVGAVLLGWVVPQFEQVFAGFGAELPAFTRLILASSRFLLERGWQLPPAIAMLAAPLAWAWRRWPRLRLAVDRAALSAPVLGPPLQASALARFGHATAVAYRAGVPLPEVLELVAGSTGHRHYEQALRQARAALANGLPLHQALAAAGAFPPLLVQMSAIGEEAGALDAMLLKVAAHYRQQASGAIDTLASVLEPLIMAFIGTIIGGMVVGMYLPIFKLASIVG